MSTWQYFLGNKKYSINKLKKKNSLAKKIVQVDLVRKQMFEGKSKKTLIYIQIIFV